MCDVLAEVLKCDVPFPFNFKSALLFLQSILQIVDIFTNLERFHHTKHKITLKATQHNHTT